MQIREQQVLFHEGGHERRGKQSFFTLYLPRKNAVPLQWPTALVAAQSTAVLAVSLFLLSTSTPLTYEHRTGCEYLLVGPRVLSCTLGHLGLCPSLPLLARLALS